jgi:hypothetical protein
MKKGFSFLPIILAIVLLGGIAGGAYYLGTKSFFQKAAPLPTDKPQLSLSPTTTQDTKQPLFSGKIKKITKDLGLFKLNDADKENSVQSSIVYYEAGTFLRGEYSGYTRVIAIRPAEGPGPSLQFVLATKDYSSYLLDDPLNKTSNYPSDDWDNPYMYIDKSKIAKAVLLDSDHPQTITVDAPFKLIKQESILLENSKIGKKDKNGNEIYQESPITEFAAPDKLPSAQTNLTLYAGGTDWSNIKPENEKEKITLTTRKQYLNKTTLVHAQDSTGLTYSYVLAPEKDIDAYVQGLATEEQKNIEYKKQVKLFNDKKLKEYPPSFEHLMFPGLRISKSSGILSADFYSTYDSAFPGACGGNQSTYIVSSITETDLKSVPSNSIFPLFELKDPKHPLYVLAYQTKTDQGDESFRAVNDNKSIPTLAEYVVKHPLLFFKDSWGRWVIIGEFDLKLMGGCGKPVVYLYPEKPTVVHLSFTSAVALNTNIPTYYNGWLVRANPDGALTDLQPQYTNCSTIDSTKFGSEYAENACKTNSYPYIYWSGKSIEKSYPQVNGGWIVEKENLSSFMQSKLNELGLTQKESNDMISYWVPKMKEKNTPYYQIGFLQTQDMNEFIPMNINPQPDSILRVFLNWKALRSKPTESPKPQQLERFKREGFVLVEWGGIK